MSKYSRGYYGIGIQNGKTEANIGTLWRSAFSLGASFIFTIGKRYKKQASDTTQSWRHIPLFEFKDIQDFREHVPYDCQIIGVEITDYAQSLSTFVHPHRAIYILGPEDGSLSNEAQELCQYIVKFDSKYCLNVAVAGSIVLYDRQTKLNNG